MTTFTSTFIQWDASRTGRKYLRIGFEGLNGGLGLKFKVKVGSTECGLGIGYLNDSKGRNIKGGLRGTIGIGLGGGEHDNPPAPTIVPVAVSCGPPAPSVYPPPIYPSAHPVPYPQPGYYYNTGNNI